ncbi:hypothetical protein BB561_002270 [Smittium simulii]|uniref:Uncharacterized protein n=1 Tax=Smittium simulii TaxID=133385 RepID=A0A2T9YR17_9FUNG|nr:hypothetical protein BB561_002270 [Smittium simulii]
MAERKAQNKYYPPDWEPSKGSINKYVGQHPLRDRARKLHEGILIIRFEMPFNIWCNGCIRFNAQKKKIGNYFSTPILSFKMKCCFCSSWFEIHTDPKNQKYIVVSGAYKKNEEYSDDSDNPLSKKELEKINKRKMTDNIFKLEKKLEDKKRAAEQAKRIMEMQIISSKRYENYGETNSYLRQQLRAKKSEEKGKEMAMKKLCNKYSLGFNVEDENFSDKIIAGSIDFQSKRNYSVKTTQTTNLYSDKIAPKTPLVTKLIKYAKINSDPFAIAKKDLRTSSNYLNQQELAKKRTTINLVSSILVESKKVSEKNKIEKSCIKDQVLGSSSSASKNQIVFKGLNSDIGASVNEKSYIDNSSLLNPLDHLDYKSESSGLDSEPD